MNLSAPYSINIKHRVKSTEIVLEIDDGPLSTSFLPHTYGVLQKELPHIFASTCFNDDDIPFRKEVLSTETGHLFEHILLEYLSSEKIRQGFSVATYSGETYWNWKKERRGRFHITVSAGTNEIDLFYSALQNSLKLFRKIMWNKVDAPNNNNYRIPNSLATSNKLSLAA